MSQRLSFNCWLKFIKHHVSQTARALGSDPASRSQFVNSGLGRHVKIIGGLRKDADFQFLQSLLLECGVNADLFPFLVQKRRCIL